jgi:hypothetical protein
MVGTQTRTTLVLYIKRITFVNLLYFIVLRSSLAKMLAIKEKKGMILENCLWVELNVVNTILSISGWLQYDSDIRRLC